METRDSPSRRDRFRRSVPPARCGPSGRFDQKDARKRCCWIVLIVIYLYSQGWLRGMGIQVSGHRWWYNTCNRLAKHAMELQSFHSRAQETGDLVSCWFSRSISGRGRLASQQCRFPPKLHSIQNRYTRSMNTIQHRLRSSVLTDFAGSGRGDS